MSTTPIADYVDAWSRRFSRKESEARAAAEAARCAVSEAVEILKKHGAKRVLLFGSLVSNSFHPGSDIDLAVEGVPKQSFVRAYADLIMALDWPVDLKPLEEVDPDFRDSVLRKGIVLHEEA